MAKYSKAAGKSVKSAVKRMKKGTLTSGKSDKKVTSKKQAIAIGLSEAREKGAKVPAKKTAAKKAAPKKPARPAGGGAAKKKSPPKKKVAAKKTAAKKSKGTPLKKAATKKAAVKKKAAPKKSARTAAKKTGGKKSAPSKSPAKKAAPKKSGAKSTTPKAVSKSKAKEKPSKAKAKMPGETSDTGEFISTPTTDNVNDPVTNADVNNIVTPETESDQAVFSATVPNQQYMPEDFKASAQDPYHGNINPSKAKTSQKPSGKKPLWDNRK